MGKRVLVLGGSGFIGHHIVRELLEQGYNVRVLSRPKSDCSLLDKSSVEIVQGILESPQVLENAIKDCNVLVHAAGHYPLYSIHKEMEVWQGLRQIQRIHRALSHNPVERFIYVSSPTAVGKYDDNHPADENAPYPKERDKSTYCKVKHSMQQTVLARADRTNAVVVAPTGVFGDGDRKPATGRIIVEIAKAKLPAGLTGFTNVVDVRDVAKGVALAIEKGETGKLYVLGGKNITLQKLVKRIARYAGVRAPKVFLEPKALYPAAWSSEYFSKIMGLEKPLFPVVGLDFAMYGDYLSSQVTVKKLGYSPTDNIELPLNCAIEWFRENRYF